MSTTEQGSHSSQPTATPGGLPRPGRVHQVLTLLAWALGLLLAAVPNPLGLGTPVDWFILLLALPLDLLFGWRVNSLGAVAFTLWALLCWAAFLTWSVGAIRCWRRVSNTPDPEVPFTGGWRWLTAPLLALAFFVMVGFNLPLRIAFQIYQPALERLVQEVSAASEPMPPGQALQDPIYFQETRWVGIYPVEAVQRRGDGQTSIRLDSKLVLSAHAGFVFEPIQRPQFEDLRGWPAWPGSNPGDQLWLDLGGGWWSVQNYLD